MVSSADIKFIRSLADKKVRDSHGLFIAEGPKLVDEALASRFTVERIIGLEKYEGLYNMETVPGKTLERISSLRSPQGIMALVRIPAESISEMQPGELVLALDGIQDPGNLGTIIRTADWFGIDRIVCSPDTADCYNPKVVQASMGSIFRVPVNYTLLENYLESFCSEVQVLGTFLDGDNIYNSDNLKSEGVIIMGNEGKGISRSVAEFVTERIMIPSWPPNENAAESLNVSTATAIICAELRRRQR